MNMAGERPKCKVVGNDVNVYTLIARVSLILERAGMREQVREFKLKAFRRTSYDEVLALAHDYVEVE